MGAVKRQFVDGPYGQIHVRTCGPDSASKRPVVLLHMFPQSGRSFVNVLPYLAKDRIAVAPDFPGHGESDIPPEPIGAEKYASAIWDAVDALGLLDTHDRIDLFGIHAGAKLAVAFANQRPQAIHRIMLCSAAVLFKEELADLKSQYKPIPLDQAGTRFKTLWSLILNHSDPNLELEMAAITLAEMLRAGEAYEWGHHSVFDYNSVFPEQLKALPHEIAVLNPGDDLNAVTPRSEAYLQNGKLFERPDWSHGFMDLHPESLAQDICSFLDGGLSALANNTRTNA